MTAQIDKIDVVEALAEALDDQVIGSLGFVLAAGDSEEFGTLVLQTWPVEGKPSVDFLCRITRHRARPLPEEIGPDAEDDDDPEPTGSES